MNVTLVTDLFVGTANGLMNVVIACIVVRWLLERVFDVDAPRLPAFLFVPASHWGASKTWRTWPVIRSGGSSATRWLSR